MTYKRPKAAHNPQPSRWVTIHVPAITLLDIEAARQKRRVSRHCFMLEAIKREVAEVLSSGKKEKGVKEDKHAA